MEADKYEVLEMIGRGSFGVIRKVRRKSDGHVLCRKEISYAAMNLKEREQLQAELAILKTLRHPNIVAYYEREHLKTTSDLHIYMEYCEQGDLAKRIKEMKKNNLMAEEDFVWSVFTQLITALYRCHYGEDPPEVGKNVIGLGSDAKPLRSKISHSMVLHRDLKPENIFLGADASVKLGDFGLSKIMQSGSFASTYVGTPFYMSPEICSAENYTLYSDIWALGCIIYELCAKEPPFNAKTHLELIQKIRLGKIKPLSGVYSAELQSVITQCLKVNANSRPDTAHLLNVPMVKLKRKELEVVAVGRELKFKEEQTNRKLKEFEQKLEQNRIDREALRLEIDDIVRREWEVKARLEIDRQVQVAIDRLNKEFDREVRKRISEQLHTTTSAPLTAPVAYASRQNSSIMAPSGAESNPVRSSTPIAEDMSDQSHDISSQSALLHSRSQSTNDETDDFPSSTDLSELSIESPTLRRSTNSVKRQTRTPFSRAQTMFEGSPMDVQMLEPSPAPIGSLGLSPRSSKLSQSKQNIFATAARSGHSATMSAQSAIESEGEAQEVGDDEDPSEELPSPTKSKVMNHDPFKMLVARRPLLLRQKTAPMQKQWSQPSLFGPARTSTSIKPELTCPEEDQVLQRQHRPPPNTLLNVKAVNASPSRRLSKVPSSTSLSNEVTGRNSPTRKPPVSLPGFALRQQLRPQSRGKTEDIRATAMVNSAVQGRTLVELVQARGAVSGGVSVRDFVEDSNAKGKETKAAFEMKGVSVTVWDPEKDEMPSPFLARGGRGVMPGVVGGPGMRHLR